MAGTPWIIATDDPTARTLLDSVLSETVSQQPEMVRRDGRTRPIRFVQRNANTTGVLYDDSGYDASSLVEVAIGSSNTPATAGSFALEFNGDNTGLTALAYNISASALATALNANPAISAAGDVTVSKAVTDGDYLVVFNDDGAQNLIVLDVEALTPPCTGKVERVQAGDADTREVQRITFKQGYLAYSDSFSASSSGSASVTVTQAGSATQPSIQLVTISANVIGGSWTLQASQAQACSVNCNGTTATVQKFQIEIPDGTTGLNGKYVDVYDASGAVRIWFDLNNGGSAPTTPVGGRLVEVDSATDTAAAWHAALHSELAADAGLDIVGGAGYGPYGIVLGVKTLVTVTDGDNGTATALTVTNFAANFGSLDQKGFIAYDKLGSVGVWINRSAAVTLPSGLEAASRIISVTSIAGTNTSGTIASTPTQVASAIATAVDADAEFVSTSAVGVVTITNASAGPRSAPSSLTPFLGINETVAGYTYAGSFGISVTPGDLELVFGNIYTVTQADEFSWQFVAVANGTNATMTASGSNLTFAPVFTGTLELNSWNMALAFAAITGDDLESTLEVQVTEPGGSPIKVLNIPVTIRRDVIDGAGLSPTTGSVGGANVQFLGAIDDYTGGTSSDLDSISTVGRAVPNLFSFHHATEGLRWYKLRAGTDAESSPAIIRPDDYNGATNAKVWESVL